MIALFHGLHSFSAVAAGFLVASVWEGIVIAAYVALLLRLLPGLTAAVRSAIWASVLLLVVLLPIVSLFAGRQGVFVAGHAAVLHASETWSLALLGVWAAVSLLRASQLAASAIRLRRVARRAVPIESNEAVAAILQASRRRVELCVSDEVDRPNVAGFFRSRILLSPELYAKLSAAELQQVVLHELEHLRRYDDWTNLLQKLSLALVPLHPVLPWVDRQMCLERELACDDSVLRRTPRKAYASCLARVAEASMVRRGFSLALGVLGDRNRERTSELANRVHRILRAPEKRMSRGRAWAATLAVIGLVFAGSAELARSPELISFAPASGRPAVSQAFASEQPFAPAQTFASPRMEPASFHSAVAYAPFAERETVARTVMRKREVSLVAPSLRTPMLRTSTLRTSTSRASMLRTSTMRRNTHRGRFAVAPLTTGPRDIVRRGGSMRGPRVTLVSWQVSTINTSSSMMPTMMVPTLSVSEDPQFLYAAVPVRDGWLIFQL